MNLKPGTRLAWLYLLTQGVSGFLWWVWLAVDPASRVYFVPDGLPDSFVVSFAIPDLLLFATGSLSTALAFALRKPIGSSLLWVLSGVMLYAALLCLGLQIHYGGYSVPTLMMLIATLCTLIFACTTKPTDPVFPVISFRVTDASGPWPALRKTLLQIIVFWGVFLWLLPMVIGYIERGIGISGFRSLQVLGWGVLFAASVLGLASAWAMSWHGRGTPLPTDAAPNLVIRGPYALVRNPMVIAGLMQGLGVMLILGSWLMLPYIMLGGIYWQFCVRPVEEADLRARFGDEFVEYENRVHCWVPSF